jgi:hypothetical protein
MELTGEYTEATVRKQVMGCRGMQHLGLVISDPHTSSLSMAWSEASSTDREQRRQSSTM